MIFGEEQLQNKCKEDSPKIEHNNGEQETQDR